MAARSPIAVLPPHLHWPPVTCREKNSRILLIVGAGRVAGNLAYAFRTVRDIEEVLVWDMNSDMAAVLVGQLCKDGILARSARNLEALVSEADIISCATLATNPLIKGNWLKPGHHLDLVGSFTPTMRETDDIAIGRARVYVDTESAFKETGDIIDPINSGILVRESVAGDLFDLCRGRVTGRGSSEEITLFKAVGTALEDLAAASMAWSQIQGTSL